jgi:flagellar motor switch protein FliN/FliY
MNGGRPIDPAGLGRLGGIEVRVSVEAGAARLTIADVLALGEGTVVELDRPANDQVDLLVNGCAVARGEVVSVDGRLSVRVTEVVVPAHATAEWAA